MDAQNDSAREQLSRDEVIAEATDASGRDSLTLVEALAVLLLDGYADDITDTTFRVGAWTVTVA